MLEIILIVLLIIIVMQEIFHFVERRDMYNRLMSKSLSEYKQGGQPPKNIPSAHERTLNNWRKKAGDK